MSSSGRTCNFRTNYVGRMVGDTAETSRAQIEEQVLSEEADVDLTKLAQFTFKHQVPSVHRVPIWKLLLKISSSAPEVRKKIADHRQQEAEVLIKSLNVMRLTSQYAADVSQNNLQVNAIDVVRMIQLGDGCPVLHANADRMSKLDVQSQMMIAKQVIAVCNGNYADAFWITKNLDGLLSKVFTKTVLDEAVESLKTRVRTFEKRGEKSFDDYNAWTRIPLCVWFRSGGSAIFDGEPLLKLWDKIFSGTTDAVIILLTIVFCAFLIEDKPRITSYLTVSLENFRIALDF